MFNFRTDFDTIVFWQSGERYHTVSWLPSRFLCINFCPLNDLQRNWSELCYLDSLACSLLKYFKLSNTALSSFLFILFHDFQNANSLMNVFNLKFSESKSPITEFQCSWRNLGLLDNCSMTDCCLSVVTQVIFYNTCRHIIKYNSNRKSLTGNLLLQTAVN